MAIRPASRPQRPLSALSTLLGVRLVAAGNSMPPNELGFLSGLTLDSRSVKPGDLYVALPGARVHGAAFCADAVAAGAVAVLTDPDGRARAVASGVPVFVLADPRGKLGEIACWVYGDPSGRLRLIGVTGTSGKTTSTYLIEAGLRAAGHKTGLVGGVELRVGDECLASSLTTPEAPDLQALFAVMVEREVTAAAMEVSSHSLVLGRVGGTASTWALHQPVAGPPTPPDPGGSPRVASCAVIGGNVDEAPQVVAKFAVPVTTFSKWRARTTRTGAPPTWSLARTAAHSGDRTGRGSRRTCRSAWPGVQRGQRARIWSRLVEVASGWRTRWRACACPGVPGSSGRPRRGSG